jgi:hypothetical protein
MLNFSTTSFLKDKFLGEEIEDFFETGWRIFTFWNAIFKFNRLFEDRKRAEATAL